MKWWCNLLLISGCFVGASLIFLQTSTAQTERFLKMQAYSVEYSYRMPPWSTSSDLEETSETFMNEGEIAGGSRFFIWEAIPKGESFDSWTRLYATTAQYPVVDDIDLHVEILAQRYEESCVDSYVAKPNSKPEQTRLFVIYCSEYKDLENIGEISFFMMKILDSTVVNNYYHIRLPAFSLDDLDQLPLSEDVMARGIDLVGDLRLRPTSQN